MGAKGKSQNKIETAQMRSWGLYYELPRDTRQEVNKYENE